MAGRRTKKPSTPPPSTPPPRKTYTHALKKENSGAHLREIVQDNHTLASILAQALRNHPSGLPEKIPSINNSLQGNLAEFFIWDLGEQHWSMFQRAWTWTANAKEPWKASSDPGIDILALPSPQGTQLLVFEIKSSVSDGISLINGQGSSLRADLEGLFKGQIKGRLTSRVGALLSELKYNKERPDLVDPVKKLIGKDPKTSPAVKLVGVLICSSSQSNSTTPIKRNTAFEELSNILQKSGWKRQQFDLRCIETADLASLLKRAVAEAIHGR